MLEESWEHESVFVHLANNSVSQHCRRDIRSINLGLFSLARMIIEIRSKRQSAIVFHSQSSLPYLLAIRYLFLWSFRYKPRLIYDMHDLLEKSPNRLGLCKYIRYELLRRLVLQSIERIVVRNNVIKTLTVSDGLADTVASRYKSKRPRVVRSATVVQHHTSSSTQREFSDNCLVYFGTKKRLPIKLIEKIASENLELHLYGRDICPDDMAKNLSQKAFRALKFFGEYYPSQLEFLDAYKYLILYSPDKLTLNYKYSLPNKLYQALSAGLSLVVSENFIELISTMSDIPGSIYVLKDHDSIQEALISLKAAKPINYHELVRKRIRDIQEQARAAYLEEIFITPNLT